MDLPDYRQQALDDLEKHAQQQVRFRDLLARGAAPGSPNQVGAAESEGDVAEAVQVLQDASRDLQLRLAALHVLSLEVLQRSELLDPVIDVFRDTEEPRELRLAALNVLQQSAFLAGGTAGRPAYLEVLRTAIDDSDPEVRRRSVGVLAREKDEYAQRRLLEGLQDPSKAITTPAKALQYLGYDVHAEYFPLLRQIVANPPDNASRREAVRLLSADPSSRGLLVQLLNDKSETREIRNLSARALQSIAPDLFEQNAREIVLDDNDYDEIRSTAATALSHFANPQTLRQDQQLTEQVQQLRAKAASPELRQASEELFSKLSAEN